MKIRLKATYIAILLFAVAGLLYVNINKVPTTHPGTIKAADGFYHSLMVEGILNSKQWNYFDYSIALGKEKALNVQPPLYYIDAALLTTFSGVPAWATFYILICLTQALFLIASYLISQEVFGEKKIALLAAFTLVLPMTVEAWLYDLYIGIWLQVAGFIFIMCYAWMFLRYVKTKETWNLFFIGLSLSSILLVHPMDLIILILPTLYLAFSIIRDFYDKKDADTFIRRVASASIIPLISVFTMLPRILFQWASQGGSQLALEFFNPPSHLMNRDYLGGLVFPDPFFLNPLIILFFLIGFVQLVMNWKKYKWWITTTLYYFFIIYITPFVFAGPDYYARFRAFTPYFAVPTAAYILYHQGIRRIPEKWQTWSVIAVGLIAVAVAVPQYSQVVDKMQGQHITQTEWQGYSWIHENTPKDARILFFGGVGQQEYIYAKRIAAAVPMNQYSAIAQTYVETNETPTTVNVVWGADTLRLTGRQEISRWNIVEYGDPDKEQDITSFDYIVFQDISQQIAQFNRVFATTYIEELGYQVVYNQNGFIILGK